MRKYYDTNGADVSSTVIAALKANSSIVLVETYWFQFVNPVVNSITPTNLFRTSAPFPISVVKLQNTPTGFATVNATFTSADITRGSFQYEVGFNNSACELTWACDDSIHLPNSAPWGIKWALLAGYLNESNLFIHQMVFLNGVLLGITLKWRGFIRGVRADRKMIVISVGSLLEIFQDVQVPTQVIQPGSRIGPFWASGNASVIGGSLGMSIDLVNSTPTDIRFPYTIQSPIPDHVFRDNYITSYNAAPPSWIAASSGVPGPVAFKIRDNVTISGTPNVLHVYPYRPINPVSMITGGGGFVNIYFPPDIGTTGVGAPGFPLVPTPETGV